MDRKAPQTRPEEKERMKAAILCIGAELLAGKTINTNQAFLGRELGKLGIETAEARVVDDDHDAICNTLTELWGKYDLLFSTGGLGPTKDDITKQAIADAFGRNMTFSEEIWESVQERFRKRGIQIPQVNRNQAEYPEGFILLRNENGTAPGLLLEETGKRLFILPGVPGEMEGIFRGEIAPRLNAAPYLYRTIHTYGIAESLLAEKLDDIVIPEGLHLAYLPQSGRVSLRVFGNAVDKGLELAAEIERRIPGHIWGHDDETLPERVQKAMLDRGYTLAVAESCTGGLVQEMLTSVSGSSAYFPGGIVSYANRIKTDLLGVGESTLAEHGAVSRETALEMATNCRTRFGVDIAGAITGIAGPDGGTVKKPVGTVHIAVSTAENVYYEQLRLIGTRTNIRISAAERLMILILRVLGELS
jgi:nicotinamide-nucleotide amidase